MEIIKMLKAERLLGSLLWLKLKPILDRMALKFMLNHPRLVKQVGKDTWVYVTKVKDAWIVGVLTKF